MSYRLLGGVARGAICAAMQHSSCICVQIATRYLRADRQGRHADHFQVAGADLVLGRGPVRHAAEPVLRRPHRVVSVSRPAQPSPFGRHRPGAGLCRRATRPGGSQALGQCHRLFALRRRRWSQHSKCGSSASMRAPKTETQGTPFQAGSDLALRAPARAQAHACQRQTDEAQRGRLGHGQCQPCRSAETLAVDQLEIDQA